MKDEKTLQAIREARETWEERLTPKLTKFPERKESFETISGLNVKRLYTPEDSGDLDYLEDLGFPGEYPYTRAVQPTAYRGRLWTMRQYAGFASAAETNARYKFLLDQGQTGLSGGF